MNPEQLTEERGKTHGDFEDNARISQELKDIFREEMNRSGVVCNDVLYEALDMIALKLSRILSGQPHFKDHWDDIAGYAHLAAKSCDQ